MDELIIFTCKVIYLLLIDFIRCPSITLHLKPHQVVGVLLFPIHFFTLRTFSDLTRNFVTIVCRRCPMDALMPFMSLVKCDITSFYNINTTAALNLIPRMK